jgi:hypothetical protein
VPCSSYPPIAQGQYRYVGGSPTNWADPLGEQAGPNASQLLHFGVGAAISYAITHVLLALLHPAGPYILDTNGIILFGEVQFLALVAVQAAGSYWEIEQWNPSDQVFDLIANGLGAMAGPFLYLLITGVVAPRNMAWAVLIAEMVGATLFVTETARRTVSCAR